MGIWVTVRNIAISAVILATLLWPIAKSSTNKIVRFPHYGSAWWLPVAATLGWGPILIAETLGALGFVLAWAYVTIACEVVVFFAAVFQILRLVASLRK